jgi:putative tryptophan/tyrosine transport system substrate-binding protein
MDVRPTITRLATLVAILLLAAPLAAQAQQAGKVYDIGYLGLGFSFLEPNRTAFYRGLREHGWIEGQNFVLTTRFAEFKPGRLREAALAAKHGTSTIPIVAVSPADAVAIGLVASLARPGANVTGLSYLGTELIGKQIELLREVAPSLSRVATLSNPANPTHAPRLRAAAIGAQGLRVHLEHIEARTPSELDKAFAAMVRARVGGVLVVSDPMFSNEARRLAQLAATSGLPAIYGFRISVDAGGLMSYGPDFSELFHRAAAYVNKILKGARPGDLPIEQPAKFELVINLRAAKALGLTIPPSLLLRADHVIQ